MALNDELTQCDKRGAEFSIYLNLGNDCSTPVWVFHKGVTGDLSINETEDQEELSTRDPSEIVKAYLAGKIDVEISGTQAVDSLYEGTRFLNSARNGSNPVDVAVLSGYITDVGSEGWRGKWRNYDRSRTGPETGAATQTFLLKPAACQSSACKVRPVMVEEAGDIADYDPAVYY